ncbi:MAG: hypothetical protein ACRD8U_14610 [Pyrinomonadaceae bacterium]
MNPRTTNDYRVPTAVISKEKNAHINKCTLAALAFFVICFVYGGETTQAQDIVTREVGRSDLAPMEGVATTGRITWFLDSKGTDPPFPRRSFPGSWRMCEELILKVEPRLLLCGASLVSPSWEPGKLGPNALQLRINRDGCRPSNGYVDERE